MARVTSGKRPRRRLRWWLALYLALLLLTHVAPPFGARDPEPRPGDLVFETGAIGGDGAARVAYTDSGPTAPSAAGEPGDAAVLVLLHGSPGSLSDFEAVAPSLALRHRVIAVDLPGFGRSTRGVPEYSARAHARYVLALLRELGIARAHLVGFSMGGVVALEAWEQDAARVASVSLVASLGAIEYELFGNYELNRVVHAGQLALLWTAENLLPHLGLLDRAFLGVPYARNFYDTDQRRMRGLLERFDPPLLVVHGADDFLVPAGAARETERAVPQARLVLLPSPADHFLPWNAPGRVSDLVSDFVRDVEAGRAERRTEARAARVALASQPFDPSSVPPASGPALLLLSLAIVLGTLVSEDLTCIAAGLLVAQGRVGFLPATLACLVGIFVGDVLLFLVGRTVGRPAVRRAPLRWVISEARVERASRWFAKRGAAAIFLSRLMPGLRLPTYFAAGLVRTRFLAFAFYFLVAASFWTPLLVGFSAWAGKSIDESLALFHRFGPLALVGLLVGLFALERVLVPSLSHRGRRLLVGSVRRKLRWEFWPRWVMYAPVAVYVGWLALRHRSLFLVTAVNPGMPLGGLVGESKGDILAALERGGAPVARFERLSAASEPDARLRAARAFLARIGVDVRGAELVPPVVLKPDVGERGSGVCVLRAWPELERRVRELAADALLQEFVDGPELGVFYYRLPGEERGRVFSVTEKRLLWLEGDGRRTLEELVLDDERAVCLAPVHLERHAARLDLVPAAGERIQLVELGTHCRGAVFLDGSAHLTPELERVIEDASRGFDGFWFGRYDLRAGSLDALHRGEVRVLELNGLTSEATHVYDPGNGVLRAWGVLFEQWRVAFEIAARNRERGARPGGPREVLAALAKHRRIAREAAASA